MRHGLAVAICLAITTLVGCKQRSEEALVKDATDGTNWCHARYDLAGGQMSIEMSP